MWKTFNSITICNIKSLQQTKVHKMAKNVFLALWIIQNAFLWLLNDPLRPDNVAKCLKTFSTIIVCNIKAIWGAKIEKMTKTCFVEKDWASDTPVVGKFCKKCSDFDSNQLTLRIDHLETLKFLWIGLKKYWAKF